LAGTVLAALPVENLGLVPDDQSRPSGGRAGDPGLLGEHSQFFAHRHAQQMNKERHWQGHLWQKIILLNFHRITHGDSFHCNKPLQRRTAYTIFLLPKIKTFEALLHEFQLFPISPKSLYAKGCNDLHGKRIILSLIADTPFTWLTEGCPSFSNG